MLLIWVQVKSHLLQTELKINASSAEYPLWNGFTEAQKNDNDISILGRHQVYAVAVSMLFSKLLGTGDKNFNHFNYDFTRR